MDVNGPEKLGLSHCNNQKEPGSWFGDVTGLFKSGCVPNGLEDRIPR